ncbi:MAG: TlpA family protein disulfide reductase [Actinomycetota bacterium]|nr:TlpA family protein disulfide reductase [Actinomycetota bacterium]
MPRRFTRRLTFSLATALAAAAALAACGSDDSSPGDAARAAPPGSGEPLAQIRAEANQLLDGGPAAFKARLATLSGHPVIVNQWASWCGPCRYEFPFFQKLANKYEGRVAFLGVDSRDSRGDAAAFLKRHPVPYPHYYDQDASVARVFRGGRSWPTTAFYGKDGQLVFTHQGSYATEAKLDQEIRRYAPDG